MHNTLTHGVILGASVLFAKLIIKIKINKIMSITSIIKQVANRNGSNVAQIENKNGIVLRQEIVFDGNRVGQSASAIRKELREQGIKGKELTENVNSILAGEKDLRTSIATLALQKATESGCVDAISENKNFVTIKVLKPKITKDQIISKQADQIAQLERIKLSHPELFTNEG